MVEKEEKKMNVNIIVIIIYVAVINITEFLKLKNNPDKVKK